MTVKVTKKKVLDQFDNCPFCDSENIDVWYYDPFDGYQGNNWRYQVKCNSCGANLERKTLEEAEVAWNRRAYALRKRREEIEEKGGFGVTKFQKELIILLAQKNMKVADAVRKLGVSRSKVETAMSQIKQETVLDPQNFFDLHELYQMVTSEVSK